MRTKEQTAALMMDLGCAAQMSLSFFEKRQQAYLQELAEKWRMLTQDVPEDRKGVAGLLLERATTAIKAVESEKVLVFTDEDKEHVLSECLRLVSTVNSNELGRLYAVLMPVEMGPTQNARVCSEAFTFLHRVLNDEDTE